MLARLCQLIAGRPGPLARSRSVHAMPMPMRGDLDTLRNEGQKACICCRAVAALPSRPLYPFDGACMGLHENMCDTFPSSPYMRISLKAKATWPAGLHIL